MATKEPDVTVLLCIRSTIWMMHGINPLTHVGERIMAWVAVEKAGGLEVVNDIIRRVFGKPAMLTCKLQSLAFRSRARIPPLEPLYHIKEINILLGCRFRSRVVAASMQEKKRDGGY